MKTYPIFKVHVPAKEALTAIGEVFTSGFINEGVEVTRLTKGLQAHLEAENLILMNSCTSALTLALKLANVDHRSSVISTPMTCVATNTPIVAAGARIHWADISAEHGMVTSWTINDAIDTDTKAVMVVAWAGNPPDLEGIRRTCDQHGIAMILDAAHAFGARYKGKPIHEWADYTCYSFQAIKHFTTGDGGALVCRDPNDYRRSKALKWFGLDRDATKDEKGNWKGQQWDADIVESGFKFNMNNVSAAIGLAQLPHAERIVQRHRDNAALYDEFFKGSIAVKPNARVDGAESSHWVYAMKVDLLHSTKTRDGLLKALNSEGVMAGVVHVPNDDYTCFLEFKTELPGVRSFSSRQFSLPCGWWLEADDIKHIATRVRELTS